MPSSTAVCPSCSQAKYASEIKVMISKMDEINRRDFPNLKGLNSYDSFVNADFNWACDLCLKTKKAIQANPGLQVTSGDRHLAYFDISFNCEVCHTKSIFSKDEMAVWYEKYQLPTHAQPNTCLTCRRQIKEKNEQNTQLSTLLKKSEKELSKSELVDIVSVYADWGNEEKMKYYQSLVNKIKE